MLLIARLSAAARRQQRLSRALKTSASQKVAAKSPWDEKRVKGGKTEGLTLASEPKGVSLFWGQGRTRRMGGDPSLEGFCDQGSKGDPGRRSAEPSRRRVPFTVSLGGSFAFRPLKLRSVRKASAAPRRSARRAPAPPPAGCPRPPSARPGGRAPKSAAAGESREPCSRARPRRGPRTASPSRSLRGHKAAPARPPGSWALPEPEVPRPAGLRCAPPSPAGPRPLQARLGPGPTAQGGPHSPVPRALSAPPRQLRRQLPLFAPPARRRPGAAPLGLLASALTFCCRRAMSVGCLALKG